MRWDGRAGQFGRRGLDLWPISLTAGLDLGTLRLEPRLRGRVGPTEWKARAPSEEAIVGIILRPFGMLLTGNLRGFFSFLLGLALVAGLWEASLASLSSHATATAIMTEVGVEVINPVLVGHSFGLSQTAYATVQKSASAHPTQPIAVPGLKVQVLGSEIKGLDFASGMRVIYAKVADAYYIGGAGGVFDVPAPLAHTLNTLALLPQAATSQAEKAAGVPHLPNVPLPPLSAVGLSAATLTAAGHAQVMSLLYWFLGAIALLALGVMAFSRGWARVTNVAGALIGGAMPGVLGLGVVWFFWTRYPERFQPFAGLLNLLIGRVLLPVYGGAAALGVAGFLLAGVGTLVMKMLAIRQAAAPRAAVGVGAGRVGEAQGWDPSAGSFARPQYRPAPGSGYGQGSEFGHPYGGQNPNGSQAPNGWGGYPPSGDADRAFPPYPDQPQRPQSSGGAAWPQGPTWNQPGSTAQQWPSQQPYGPAGAGNQQPWPTQPQRPHRQSGPSKQTPPGRDDPDAWPQRRGG